MNHWGQVIPVATAGASGAQRLALRVMQVGAVAVVLLAVPFKTFELDRFFVPKEAALHATATLAAVLCVASARRIQLRRTDAALALVLVLATVAAALATNPWLAARALAIALSGAALFWCARSLAGAGLARPLLNAIAVAVVLGAATSLLQTYGVRTRYFSLNRAPGGTFGNRNFVAHLCAFGLPIVCVAALRTRRSVGFLLGLLGLGILTAVLFITRSRAAWLALLAMAGVLVPFAWRGRHLWRGTGLAARVVVVLASLAGGAAAGALLPNALHWVSDNPYLETARGIVNASEGSGAGRLVQYGNSARIARAHPLLGVGPGNWPVAYPRFADGDDPSMSSEAGVTSNPWPSSDWVAHLAEIGVPALLLLVGVFVGLAAQAWCAAGAAEDIDAMLAALGLAGTLVAAAVAGLFDAVLLLPAPAFIVWTALGAFSPPSGEGGTRPGGLARFAGAALILAVGGALTLKSALQIQSMAIVHGSSRAARLESAAALDPGSYRIRLLLAQQYARRGSCRRARPHAAAAHALFPEARAAARLVRRCGKGERG